MINKVLVICICFCLLSQCSSDEEPVFSGITETNLNNELVGDVDNTDWQLNEKWSEKVASLFDDTNISDINNSSFTSIDAEIENILGELGLCFANGRTKSVCIEYGNVIAAYPNPARYFFNLNFDIDKAAIKNFKLVMVNQKFEQLTSFNEYGGRYSIDTSSLKPGTYRVYYLIQTIYSELVLKGHGDLAVK